MAEFGTQAQQRGLTKAHVAKDLQPSPIGQGEELILVLQFHPGQDYARQIAVVDVDHPSQSRVGHAVEGLLDQAALTHGPDHGFGISLGDLVLELGSSQADTSALDGQLGALRVQADANFAAAELPDQSVAQTVARGCA